MISSGWMVFKIFQRIIYILLSKAQRLFERPFKARVFFFLHYVKGHNEAIIKTLNRNIKCKKSYTLYQILFLGGLTDSPQINIF